MRRLIPLLFLFSLCACGTVHSPVPFGAVPLALEASEWDGAWCAAGAMLVSRSTPANVGDESACVTLTVVDPGAGVVDVLMPPDGDTPAQLLRAHLRAIPGQGTRALVWVDADGDYQCVARVEREGSSLTLWDAGARGFAEEIDAGRLPGRTEGGDAWLAPIDEAAVARIVADEGGRFFDWRSPITLVKVTD